MHYRYICSEIPTLDTNGVQQCGSPEGWVVQQLPDPFQVSQLSAIDLGGALTLGFFVYFILWIGLKFIHQPIDWFINAIRRANGDRHRW